MARPALSDLDLGFRTGYLDYDTVARQLRGWADAYPDLARLEVIGRTEQGRDLLVLTLGPEPDRARPAVWVDGNMHAAELAGSSVALAIAEDILRLHLEPDRPLHDLGQPARDTLREVLVHVMPRMSPDGAEAVLTSARPVRSSPRDTRPHHNPPRWQPCDVDGDGVVRSLRMVDPGGDYISSPARPDLMLPREIDDPGPFYRLYPEGVIEPFDGHTIPPSSLFDAGETDLNRNFPWGWAPEHAQAGAGAYPASEPESRAVIEYTTARPTLFAWLDLHTFGGVGIRPLGNAADSDMDQTDLAIYRQVAAWLEAYTGYPMVSGFEEFTYTPNYPLRGDMTDYGYHQRGCICYVIELWDLFHRLGLTRPKPFVDSYSRMTRDDLLALADWDRDHNQGRVFRPWRRIEHPQLGPVEVGGVDPRIGLWNPPPELLAELCTGHSAAFLRVAAMAPRLRVDATCELRGDDLTRVTVAVANHGYLPTYVLSSARKLDFAEPLYADLAGDGCTLEDGPAHREVGHLEGWGHGRFTRANSPHGMRSDGNRHQRVLDYLVRGHGTVTVRVGSCRTGFVEKRIGL